MMFVNACLPGRQNIAKTFVLGQECMLVYIEIYKLAKKYFTAKLGYFSTTKVDNQHHLKGIHHHPLKVD